MHQTPSLQQLTDRIVRLEKEIALVRQELADLGQFDFARLWAAKEEQKRQIATLFSTLSIRGTSISSQMLQEKMSQSGLAPDELSQSIIKAREE